jgi:lysozyme
MITKQNLNQALTIVAEICRHFEGFSEKPYLCPAGFWTIGYGTVYKPDGSRVTKDHESITKEIANQWLLHELENNYMLAALSKSPGLATNPLALAAITDFCYNLGNARYRASTLAKMVNQENWSQARLELLKWTRGAGKVLPGLVARRNYEAKLLPN